MTLSERLSSATADQQRELLELAWDAVARDRGIAWAADNAQRFVRMLDAEAYLDAAVMLVPEGWNWMAGNRNLPIARAYIENGKPAFSGMAVMRRNPARRWFEDTATTPALALAAASLRARAAIAGDRP